MKIHLSDGEIRHYHDGEGTGDERLRTANHLESCARCREKSRQVLSRMHFAGERLAFPSAALQPPKAARQRLERRLKEIEKEKPIMSKNIFNRVPRPAWVMLAVAVILAAALSFPSVRAIATSFLGLFRVERVQVVPVDMENFSSRFGSAATFEQFLANEIQVEQFGETREVDDLTEASSLAGMAVRLPSMMEGPPKLAVQPGGRVRFQVDYQLLRAVLDEIGRSDIALPEDLDGAEIALEMQAAVTAMYGECPSSAALDPDEKAEPEEIMKSGMSDCTTLLQMPSPTISAPPGLNIAQIGEAYLQILGMSQEDAARFASNVDWTTTFVFPIPSRAEYQDVRVDGVTGTLIEFYERGYRMYALIWVKGGMLYGLSGPGEGLDALEAANSLK